jgi:hypothetical protein
MSDSRVSISRPEYCDRCQSVGMWLHGWVQGLGWQPSTYSANHLGAHIGMLLLVTLGEDVVMSGVHLHAIVPGASRPFRPRSVHVAEEIWVVGDEEVRPDTCG